MDYFEFLQWVEFYGEEPFGYPLSESQHAQLQTTIANVSGNLKNPLSPADFMRPKPQPEPTEIQDEQTLKAWLNG